MIGRTAIMSGGVKRLRITKNRFVDYPRDEGIRYKEMEEGI